MLEKLIINNFAIIKSVEIEFSKGLNIITGETGSGKSLIVNALDLLMGAKFNKVNFRSESVKEIEIIGYFLLDDKNIEIKREFNSSGKHKIFINQNKISTKDLKKNVSNYIDMHGQHSQHSILNKLTHIDYLDDFGDYSRLLNDISMLFLKNEKNKKDLEQLQDNNKNIIDKKELYNYQLAELNEIDIYEGIDHALSQKYDKISNIEEIRKSIDDIIYLLDSGDDNLKTNISTIIKTFNGLAAVDKTFSRFTEVFESIKIDIDELNYDLSSKKNEYIFDKEQFSKISEDLEKVQMIKRKYGGTISSAISYKSKIEKYLNDCSDNKAKLELLRDRIQNDKKKLEKLADKISEKRLENIPIFEKKINKTLEKLNMEDAVFSVSLAKAEAIHEKGHDYCEFYIKTNKGSKIKPIVKIASGGELSRIMLAIKILMQDKTKKNTMIFDEIDLGVSGRAADNLGNNLLELSKGNQVICISHLPQVACKGDTHYRVFKKTNKNLTFSNVIELNSESRINEIAQMISGDRITSDSLKQAKYLLGM